MIDGIDISNFESNIFWVKDNRFHKIRRYYIMTQAMVDVKRFIDIYVGLPRSLNDFRIL
jgi:hypothetical protein